MRTTKYKIIYHLLNTQLLQNSAEIEELSVLTLAKLVTISVSRDFLWTGLDFDFEHICFGVNFVLSKISELGTRLF